MKKTAQIAKSVILVAMFVIASCDAIVVMGEDNGTMGLTKFIIIKATGLAAAYGLYKLGEFISNKNLLPDWWNKLVTELKLKNE